MNALELFREGQLAEAIRFQKRLVEESPNAAVRLLLGELLLFAGEFDAARQQFDALSGERTDLDEYVGACSQLIDAERQRQQIFVGGEPHFLLEPSEALTFRIHALEALREGESAEASDWLDEADACTPWVIGHIDGREFDGIRDTDDFFSLVLEVFVAGRYVWFPFEEVRRLRIGKMELLRDHYFIPAWLTAKNGEEWLVHLPALYVGSHRHSDETIRAGLTTDWDANDEGPMRGFGRRLLTFGEEELSLGDFTQWES